MLVIINKLNKGMEEDKSMEKGQEDKYKIGRSEENEGLEEISEDQKEIVVVEEKEVNMEEKEMENKEEEKDVEYGGKEEV